MARAIEIARESVDAPGTLPYGAVVVKDGKIIGEGLNRSYANSDPTSHGEVEAIRDACKRLSVTSLKNPITQNETFGATSKFPTMGPFPFLGPQQRCPLHQW